MPAPRVGTCAFDVVLRDLCPFLLAIGLSAFLGGLSVPFQIRYHNSVGEQFPRAQGGLLTRPTVAEVFAYRHVIDNRLCELLASHGIADLAAVVELGIQHEQQHQELIVTDLKYLLGFHPL